MLGGLAIFGVASLGAALAPSLAFLIVFRVLQAVSGAVVFPNGAGLIRELVPADRRGGAFGIVGGSIALAAGLGPLIGGVLVAAGGWRAIFLVNIPFVAAALAIAWRAVPRRPGAVADDHVRLARSCAARDRPDRVGAPRDRGWPRPGDARPGYPAPARARRCTDLVGATAPRSCLSAALLRDPPVRRRQRRHLLQQPCVLHRPACDSRSCSPATSSGRASRSGLALALLSAPMIVFSPIGAASPTATAGACRRSSGASSSRSACCHSALAAGLSPYALLPCLALMGAGVGLSTAGLQTSAIEALDPSQSGVAAGPLLDVSLHRQLRRFDRPRPATRPRSTGSPASTPYFVIALAGAIVSVLVTMALPVPPRSVVAGTPSSGGSYEAEEPSTAVSSGTVGTRCYRQPQ